MAGIAGIVVKNKEKGKDILEKAFAKMMNTLAYSKQQKSGSYMDEKCYLGNVLPLIAGENDHFVENKHFPFCIIIDGLLFLSLSEKNEIEKQYDLKSRSNDYDYLPYLFHYYGKDFLHHVTGTFNIFMYNKNSGQYLLANDRLGYLPLYYYQDQSVFLFASKLESILASGLMEVFEIDKVTVAEHLLFNYPLSEHTYVKNINTISPASCIRPVSENMEVEQYWDIGDYFGFPSLSKKESLTLLNTALQNSIEKFVSSTGNSNLNFSLTGGWDSRVVLSYLLPAYRDKIQAYSFGAPVADDIKVPEEISFYENFDYTGYRLDNEYLQEQFPDNAKDTVILSNGTRNYKRTHYLYAIKQVAKKSEFLLSGIYGDEVFKVGRPQAGTVISAYSIKFIDADFDADEVLKQANITELSKVVDRDSKRLYLDLKDRLNAVGKTYKKYNTPGEKYFAFRFWLNLRKYFGHEVNSYNDFVYCYSPFIEHDFLKEFAKTKFMVSRFGFEPATFKEKAQSSQLYYKLTKLNKVSLTRYKSSRGFKMKNAGNYWGWMKILISRFRQRLNNNKDEFNTNDTTRIFRELIENESMYSGSGKINEEFSSHTINEEDLLSLKYYLLYLQKTYQ